MDRHFCTYLPNETVVKFRSIYSANGVTLVKDMWCRKCGTTTRVTTSPNGMQSIERIPPPRFQ